MIICVEQKQSKPTLTTLTLLVGTLTLIFWIVHLGLFSSEKLISSENVS